MAHITFTFRCTGPEEQSTSIPSLLLHQKSGELPHLHIEELAYEIERKRERERERERGGGGGGGRERKRERERESAWYWVKNRFPIPVGELVKGKEVESREQLLLTFTYL